MKIIRRMVTITGIIFSILLNVVFFGVINKHPFSITEAKSVLTFGQQILPLNPIEKVSPIVPQTKKGNDEKGSQFRLVGNIVDSEVEKNKEDKSLPKIRGNATFKGKSLFPNSQIYLEIHSTTFYARVKSDSEGSWSWKKAGQPLEDGVHTIEAYTVSPFQFSSKSDVFTEKFMFVVDSKSVDVQNTIDVKNNTNYVEKLGDGDLGDKLIQNSINNMYFFDVVTPDKKEYLPGDDIDLALVFSDLGDSNRKEAKVNFDIYENKKDGIKQVPVASFSDDINTGEFSSFLKKIHLKDKLVEGEYEVAVNVVSNEGNVFVQNGDIKVSDIEAIRIGNFSMKKDQFLQLTIWNIIGLLIILILLICATIYEYERMMIFASVSEKDFKKKHFF